MGKAVQSNFDNLEKMIKALKEDYTLRVGIIGSKATKIHANSDLTNAEIGTIHEQPERDGKKIPRRSFLEDSLKFKITSDANEWRAIKKDAAETMIKQFSVKTFLAKLGAKCLGYIDEGFDTNGFGQWKPLANDKRLIANAEAAMKAYRNLERSMQRGKKKYSQEILDKKFQEVINPNPRILQDTGEMKKSISFKVFKNK